MPLRFVIVGPLPPPVGGIATWMTELLKQVSLDSSLEAVHINSRVRFRRVSDMGLGSRTVAGSLYSVVLVAKLFITLIRRRFDVVHICTSGSLGVIKDLILMALSRCLLVPVVLHLHFGRMPALVASRTWETTLMSLACRLAARVIVMDSRSVSAVRQLVPASHVSFILNPVWNMNATAAMPSSEDGAVPVVLFAGVIGPAKGMRELVAACRGICTVPFRLNLVGPVEAEFRSELEGISSGRDAGAWLRFAGPQSRSETLNMMARATVVVLPSHSEGCPNLVLEAMALRKAVIATGVGAVPDLLLPVGSDPCGIVVEVGDVGGLASAIQKLLVDRGERLEFGRRAADRVGQVCLPERIFAEYRSLWIGCAAARPTRRAPREFTLGEVSRQRPIRVAMLSPLPPPSGGIAIWTQEILKFISHEEDVTVVHINGAIRFRGTTNTDVFTRIWAGVLYSPGCLWRFARTLLGGSFDVVHICSSASFGLLRDLVATAFARCLRVPVVLHFRFGRLPALVESRDWETVTIRVACRLASRVVVLETKSAAALLVLIPSCRVSVIPNPAWCLEVADNYSSAELSGAPVIQYSGHVMPSKGIRELVLACRDIGDLPFRLDLVGPVLPEFMKELEDIARDRDNGAWLNIVGEIGWNEVLERVGASFAVVLSSHTEGFPNVVLEAMALGKPVIATRVGAIPEMLLDSDPQACGICVDVGDVAALGSSVRYLLANPTIARSMGARARDRVRRLYSPQVVFAQYRTLWAACAPVASQAWARAEASPLSKDTGGSDGSLSLEPPRTSTNAHPSA